LFFQGPFAQALPVVLAWRKVVSLVRRVLNDLEAERFTDESMDDYIEEVRGILGGINVPGA
jgi:hypothetical protein